MFQIYLTQKSETRSGRTRRKTCNTLLFFIKNYLVLYLLVLFFFFVCFPLRVFCYRVCALTRKTESEKSPRRGDGHAAIPSPSFSSWDLGHARTHAQHEFKPPGLGLEPWLTTWESSDIAITLTAGPSVFIFYSGTFCGKTVDTCQK